MKRSAIALLAATLASVGLLSPTALAAVQPGDTVNWVGGATGQWHQANAWQRVSDSAIGDSATILGTANGSNGADSSATSGENIVIGGGSTVRFYEPNGGLSIKQGSNLIVKDGATLYQETDNTYTENQWTLLDASNIILDGGTFRRVGSSPTAGDGGGISLFGSWRSDDNFARIPAPAKINVLITNGGKFENEGDLWFGAGDDTPDDGLHVNMEINNGTVDLTGGDVYPDDQEGVVGTADLVFIYKMHPATLTPVDTKHVINFTGAGSLTVDKSGINVAIQDTNLVYNGRTPAEPYTTLVTYEQLWDDGILRSHGISGASLPDDGGVAFANFFTVSGTPGQDNYTVTAKTGTTVTWDGGNGAWQDPKWNGGQDAQTAMGRTNGTENGHRVVIGGGAQVSYLSDQATAYNSDFRLKSVNGQTSVTIKEGAKLSIISQNTDADSKWTEWDGDLTLDNGTLERGFNPIGDTVSGGALMFGSWRSVRNQQIDINIVNGGRLVNNGQVHFGAGEDQAHGLEVTMTINNGTVDLTGGDNYPVIGVGGPEADLSFFYDFDDTLGVEKNEKYSINFTGPGSITVDKSGIAVYDLNESGFDIATKTYQQLWDLGILQANGLSGVDGATFGTYFSTTGTLGQDNYTLTSLLTGPGLAGDFDNDGNVDGNDFLVWQRGGSPSPLSPGDLATWKSNFGSGSSAASVGAVPEPASLVVALVGLAGLGLAGARRRS